MNYKLGDKVLFRFSDKKITGVINSVLLRTERYYVKTSSSELEKIISNDDIIDSGTHIKIKPSSYIEEINKSLKLQVCNTYWDNAILSQVIQTTNEYDLIIIERVNKDNLLYKKSKHLNLLKMIKDKHLEKV